MELNLHFTFEKNDTYAAVGAGKAVPMASPVMAFLGVHWKVPSDAGPVKVHSRSEALSVSMRSAGGPRVEAGVPARRV